MVSADRRRNAKLRDGALPGGEPGRYRQEAARCRKLAEASNDPETCRQWLSLGEAYLDLAEAADIIEASAGLAAKVTAIREN